MSTDSLHSQSAASDSSDETIRPKKPKPHKLDFPWLDPYGLKIIVCDEDWEPPQPDSPPGSPYLVIGDISEF